MSYRTPAPKLAELPTARPVGPTKLCPWCGIKMINDKNNWAGTRIAVCWSGKSQSLFRRCQEHGKHLHQSCDTCSGSWTCDVAGEPT